MNKRMASILVFGVLFAGLLAPAWAKTTVTIYLTDAQGTPVVETDAQGGVIQKMAYQPYGAQVLGMAKHGPGYTGHVEDTDTGLVYMQARYYDPGVGRFLSLDPASISMVGVFSFNNYAYVNNNPIANTDPTGMWTDPDSMSSPGFPGSVTGSPDSGYGMQDFGVDGAYSNGASEYPPINPHTNHERVVMAEDYLDSIVIALEKERFSSPHEASDAFKKAFADISAKLGVEFSANIIDLGKGHVFMTDFYAGENMSPKTGLGWGVQLSVPDPGYRNVWWGWIHTHPTDDHGFSWSDVSNYNLGYGVNAYVIFATDKKEMSFSIDKWRRLGSPSARYVYYNQRKFEFGAGNK